MWYRKYFVKIMIVIMSLMVVPGWPSPGIAQTDVEDVDVDEMLYGKLSTEDKWAILQELGLPNVLPSALMGLQFKGTLADMGLQITNIKTKSETPVVIQTLKGRNCGSYDDTVHLSVTKSKDHTVERHSEQHFSVNSAITLESKIGTKASTSANVAFLGEVQLEASIERSIGFTFGAEYGTVWGGSSAVTSSTAWNQSVDVVVPPHQMVNVNFTAVEKKVDASYRRNWRLYGETIPLIAYPTPLSVCLFHAGYNYNDDFKLCYHYNDAAIVEPIKDETGYEDEFHQIQVVGDNVRVEFYQHNYSDGDRPAVVILQNGKSVGDGMQAARGFHFTPYTYRQLVNAQLPSYMLRCIKTAFDEATGDREWSLVGYNTSEDAVIGALKSQLSSCESGYILTQASLNALQGQINEDILADLQYKLAYIELGEDAFDAEVLALLPDDISLSTIKDAAEEKTWAENVEEYKAIIKNYLERVTNFGGLPSGISSLRIIDMNQPYACLFQEANYTGKSRCFNIGQNDPRFTSVVQGESDEFNDNVRSIKVSGVEVQLYRGYNYDEPLPILTRDQVTLGSEFYARKLDGDREWYDGPSSIKILPATGEGDDDQSFMIEKYLDETERTVNETGVLHDVQYAEGHFEREMSIRLGRDECCNGAAGETSIDCTDESWASTMSGFVVYVKVMPIFTLTTASFTGLAEAGVPENIRTGLGSLENQEYPGKENFLAAVQGTIGTSDADAWRSQILASAEKEYRGNIYQNGILCGEECTISAPLPDLPVLWKVEARPYGQYLFSGWKTEAGQAISGKHKPLPGDTIYAVFDSPETTTP